MLLAIGYFDPAGFEAATANYSAMDFQFRLSVVGLALEVCREAER
jgi:hypothetical protein